MPKYAKKIYFEEPMSFYISLENCKPNSLKFLKIILTARRYYFKVNEL